MKLVLGDKFIIDKFKNDSRYLGSIFVDFPNEHMKIDIDNLPEEAKEVYIFCHNYYMSYFWLNHDKLKNLKIYIVERIDDELLFFPYEIENFDINMFSKIDPNNVEYINKIILYGKKSYSYRLFEYLTELGYSVIQTENKETINQDNIVINFSNKNIENSIPAYLLGHNVRVIINKLSSYNKIDVPNKTLINFLINNFKIAKYNPFAALAYFYISKLKRKHKKSIGFYAPSKAYRNNLTTDKVLKNLKNKLDVFLFFNEKSNDKFEEYPESYYTPNSLFAYFDFLDLIVIPQLDILLPKKPEKIYVLHDIYDSPLGKAESLKKCKDKKTIKYSKFILLLDYKFMPSKPVFDKEMENFKKFKPYKCRIPGGYFKLDGNILKFKKLSKKFKVDSIVYAPTVINEVFEEYSSQYKYGKEIIKSLLDNFEEYNIIFRPHPHSLNHSSTLEIVETFKNNDRFIFDNNPSEYMESYTRSKLLITDISGTAYTYAFTTLRPVIFFAIKDEEAQKSLNCTFYFKDRGKIGDVAFSIEDLIKKVKKFLYNNDYNLKKIEEIKKLRENVIFNIGKSEEYFVECIEYILSKKKKPEWECSYSY